MWLLNRLAGSTMSLYFFSNLLTTFVLGVLISHAYRQLVVRLDWLKLKIIALIPRVVLSSLICGSGFYVLHSFISEVLISGETVTFDWLDILQTTLNLSVIFLVWSSLYFLFHFIQNYRKEEIKNLRWQALSNEVELNKLKSQLNPHFIFNSMNSIRALVDENPEKSKDSITQLSNILRSSLLMGRKKTISLSEELQLVNDYLSLEKTRFEERLQVEFEIKENSLDHQLPPMILQSMVENGIKHGISKLADGGNIKVISKKDGSELHLTIINSGQLKSSKNDKEVGFGLLNSRQRLNLLYGSRANLFIENTSSTHVIVKMIIPANVNRTLVDQEEIVTN